MQTAQTQILSYQKTMQTGLAENQYEIIMNYLLTYDNLSRNDISRMTGIKLSSVCERINELKTYGYITEVKNNKKYDRVTKRHVNIITPIVKDY